MNQLIKRVSAALLLVLITTFLSSESAFHFDQELIQIKRQNSSAQRNWNLFYGQRFVFYDGSVRYEDDFQAIRAIIKPGQVVLSDMATSYYAASYLPMYARNVHRHQGRSSSAEWRLALDSRLFCEMHRKESFIELEKFVTSESMSSRKTGLPMFKYVLINNDKNNRNVRLDCLWQRRAALVESIAKISNKVFDGEYLVLYELKGNLSTTASDRY